MMVHPIGMMRAATGGGGSAPTLRGVTSYGKVNTASPSIGLHASTAEGDSVIIAITGAYTPSTVVSKPSWLTLAATIEPFQDAGQNGTWVLIFTGQAPSSPPATADFTLSNVRETMGGSMVYEGGVIGTTGTKDTANAPVTSYTTDAITVSENSTLAVVMGMALANGTVSSTPTEELVVKDAHYLTKTLCFTDVPGQSAGSSDTVSYTLSSARVASMVVEVEPT